MTSQSLRGEISSEFPEERGANTKNMRGISDSGAVSFVPYAQADRMVRDVRNNVQSAIVFVDAEDFSSLSTAQKQEYFFVALSNKSLHVVVYNERGQIQDGQLAALLKLDRVTRTDRALSMAVNQFSPSNVPAIHVCKNVLPSPELVSGLRKKVGFFKTKSEKSGTLATALLWAISGGEEGRIAGVRKEDGFWTVEETLLEALQKTFESKLVIAIAA